VRGRASILYRDHFGVQRHGWADVPGNAVENRPDGKLAGARCLEDEVLFVMGDGLRIAEIGEVRTRMRHLGGDGFVADIEAQTVSGGLADNTSEQHRGVQEVEVGQVGRVTPVPQRACARSTLHVGPFGVQRECRRAAGDDARPWQPSGHDLLAQLGYGGKRLFAGCSARLYILIMNVSVVRVQSTCENARQ
jgi:hypothetical protein